MMSIRRLLLSASGIALLCYAGCADLRDDLLQPVAPGVSAHPSGWADPGSASFHGAAIRDAGWDMRSCRTCHGLSYGGGTAMVSCLTCHDQPTGPEHCTTCHGSASNAAPPTDLRGNTARTFRGVGAHQKHFVGGSLASPIPCSGCHAVPPSVYVPGHVDSPSPAEVPMAGALARTVTNEPTTTDYDLTLPLFSPVPSLDSAAVSCANTYCHGNFKNGNDTLIVTWTDTSSSAAACGTCHGDVTRPTLAERARPKSAAEGGTHPNSTACSACHADVVDASVRIISTTKHINGKLNVFGEERDF